MAVAVPTFYLRARPGGLQARHAPTAVHISMPPPSFRKWLEDCPEEVPDAGRFTQFVAQSGVSCERLLPVLHVSPETLGVLLRGLLTAVLVAVVQVDGKRVYRMTMQEVPWFGRRRD